MNHRSQDPECSRRIALCMKLTSKIKRKEKILTVLSDTGQSYEPEGLADA